MAEIAKIPVDIQVLDRDIRGVIVTNISEFHSGYVETEAGGRIILKPGEQRALSPGDEVKRKSPYITVRDDEAAEITLP